MAVYAYIASSGSGSAPIRGTIAADSPRQARDRLRAQGLSIRELDEQRAARAGSALSRYLARRQSAKVAGLFQEMTTLLSAGIPLLGDLTAIRAAVVRAGLPAALWLLVVLTAALPLAARRAVSAAPR